MVEPRPPRRLAKHAQDETRLGSPTHRPHPTASTCPRQSDSTEQLLGPSQRPSRYSSGQSGIPMTNEGFWGSQGEGEGREACLWARSFPPVLLSSSMTYDGSTGGGWGPLLALPDTPHVCIWGGGRFHRRSFTRTQFMSNKLQFWASDCKFQSQVSSRHVPLRKEPTRRCPATGLSFPDCVCSGPLLHLASGHRETASLLHPKV